MPDSLFPFFQIATNVEKSEPPHMFRDIQWDFVNNEPLFIDGEPAFTQGHDAVMSWAYRALATERGKFLIFTADYGCEIQSLIGQGFSSNLIKSECERYIIEALEINPYIESINNVIVELVDNGLTISCEVKSIYDDGTVKINV